MAVDAERGAACFAERKPCRALIPAVLLAAQVFLAGPLQALHDKQIEIKRAVPRDQMPQPRGMMMMRPPAYGAYGAYGGGRGMYGYSAPGGYPMQGQYGQPSYGPPAYRGGGGGLHAGLGSHINTTHLGVGALASNLNAQQQQNVGMAGSLGGGMPSPVGGGLGSYGASGLGGGLGSGLTGAGDAMGLGSPMGGPMGSLGSGIGGYSLNSNAGGGGGGSFNMAALHGALPGVSRGVSDPAQPSSLPNSVAGGRLDGGYPGGGSLDVYSAGGQGADAYSGGPGDAAYGSVGTPGAGGSVLADAFSGQQAADSYQSGGALGAAGGDLREGYSGSASPVTAGFSASSAGFAAQAAAAAQGAASPSAAYLAQQSPTAFSGSLASVTTGMAGSRDQAPVTSAFNASSFTESPLAWS